MEKVVLAVAGDADRLVAAALSDVDPVLSELQGRVLIVGGLMQAPLGLRATARYDALHE